MQVISTVNEMQTCANDLRNAGRKIAFVPTMGYLHEGHLSLVRKARESGDVVVVSIFVNPTQFGPSEDLDKYPRNLDKDLEACESEGVDYVFAPPTSEMYPSGYSTFVNEESLSGPMCGKSRPAFFRGVCTVLTKLFNIVKPHVAVFGQKDAQQAAVVKHMVKDLNLELEIVVAPTVREADGLAMSSRNSYLKPFQRQDAVQIHKALQKGAAIYESGIDNIDRILAEIIHHLSTVRRLRVIYAEAVDLETMKPLRTRVEKGHTLIATAVWCDEIRLIDNIIL
ncbi:MAG: pantoate--beta-alanine ligase [Opitutales bacterium]|nr:pantoate--beta-alanine ligase [Opitutales bacterium]